MNYTLIPVSFIFLIACTPDLGRTLRIACGFSDVIISEVDIGRLEKLFGADESIGSQLCKIVRDASLASDGLALPSANASGTTLNIKIGDEEFFVLVSPPRAG